METHELVMIIGITLTIGAPLCMLALLYQTYYEEKRRRQQRLNEIKDDLNKLRNNINEIEMVLSSTRKNLQKRKEEKK